MTKNNQCAQVENNQVNVETPVETKTSSYERVLRVRMGVKAGMDRCSKAA